MGNGFQEVIYQRALAKEMTLQGLSFSRDIWKGLDVAEEDLVGFLNEIKERKLVVDAKIRITENVVSNIMSIIILILIFFTLFIIPILMNIM